MSLGILEYVEAKRLGVIAGLHRDSKSLNGQYMTPAPIAAFMAGLFSPRSTQEVRLLDPGAGIGSLLSAFLDQWCNQGKSQGRVSVTAYEIDPHLLSELRDTLVVCEERCRRADVAFSAEIVEEDFVLSGSGLLARDLFSLSTPIPRFTHAILNPPYKKIHGKSEHRLALRRAGIETSNLYTAFLAITIRLLEPGGELVAIVPRSFCNGPYFLSFRELLLGETTLRRIHVFHSRESAFRDDDVLQENIIFYAIKGGEHSQVIVSSSNGRDFGDLSIREVPFGRVVNPADKRLTIHIPTNDVDRYVLDRVAALPCALDDLGLQVSTGPVIDFRLREYIHDDPEQGTVPLIYPAHFEGHKTSWPLHDHRKPNAIDDHPASRKWLMPNGYYVLTRRFSSKEERRRIVAAQHDPREVEAAFIGFENHLNVFHASGRGLDKKLARGLTAYLNSTLVDLYFRQFSGHTQVNATDLRMLPYPSERTLIELGAFIDESGHCLREEIDAFLETSFGGDASISSPDPVRIVRRIEEASEVLGSLGVPKHLQDELSAQYLLALLNLKPESAWSEAAASALTCAQILDFIHRSYGRKYVPRTQGGDGASRLRMFEKHGIVRVIAGDQEEAADQEAEIVCVLLSVVDFARSYVLRSQRKSL